MLTQHSLHEEHLYHGAVILDSDWSESVAQSHSSKSRSGCSAILIHEYNNILIHERLYRYNAYSAADTVNLRLIDHKPIQTCLLFDKSLIYSEAALWKESPV